MWFTDGEVNVVGFWVLNRGGVFLGESQFCLIGCVDLLWFVVRCEVTTRTIVLMILTYFIGFGVKFGEEVEGVSYGIPYLCRIIIKKG